MKKSPIWGLMILPVLMAWFCGLRVCWWLIGMPLDEFNGARQGVVLIFALLGTALTVGVAYENSEDA